MDYTKKNLPTKWVCLYFWYPVKAHLRAAGGGGGGVRKGGGAALREFV